MRAWTAQHPQTGISIARIDTGGVTTILNYKGDIGRRPASTLKIVTAAGALMTYGANHRFTTTLSTPALPLPGGTRLDSTLYLTGGGDPMLGTPGYLARYLSGGIGTGIKNLARPLRKAGIRTITGTIVVDESRFDRRRRVASWPARYVIECAPVSAVNVNQGFAGNTRGRYAAQPPLSAGAKLRAAFRSVGIAHSGRVVTGRTPASATAIATVRSPKLTTILRVMLADSDNYIAETLLKNTGAAAGGTGTTAAGITVERGLVGRWFGPRNRVVDGSGLDRGNLVTPRSMVRLLVAANGNAEWGAPLIAQLARGGEGTLLRRFTAPGLRDRVHAKTGSLSDASTLAGVVDSRGGARYAFAILMNDAYITDAKLTQDRIVKLLASGVADDS